MSDVVRPEDFLELVQRSRKGRLKVYLGFAAGVGKTYRMLEEAYSLKKRGVDVILGFIETHQRTETVALVRDLEEIPRKKIEYRGVIMEEMNLEKVIARKPQVVIVDELAHTNVPGSKNRKRYQDVWDILDQGINVICAFNVQHLESLNDLIERNTGVRVRETVPDIFLKQADQVVNLDLAVEDLQERLRSGKIYDKEKIPWALEHFFKGDNLVTLRELALREVAESLDRTMSIHRLQKMVPNTGRVLVCLSLQPAAAAILVRKGSRLAGRLNTDWFVIHVEKSNAQHNMDSTIHRQLNDSIDRAKELGAEVFRLQSNDSVMAIIEFARAHRISHIMLGRPRWSFWTRLWAQGVAHRLLNEAKEFDLHIVAIEDNEEQNS